MQKLSPAELEIDRLKVVFPLRGAEHAVVNNVSFNLKAGETLALVGESGSGKSVTALSILRLTPQPGRIDSGCIRFRGEDVLAMSGEKLRSLRGNRVAMIFQEPMTALNPVHTLADQIGEPLRLHRKLDKREARAQAVELLRRVEIPSPERIADSYPHQLSGGMRQRAVIAMAIACNPAVLIADEPTTALDVLVQEQILDLLQRLQHETGMAALWITHDLGVVARVAQRVMVMYAGEIVESGPARAVLDSPRHPYTRGLIHSLPTRADIAQTGDERPRLREIPGTVPSPEKLPAGCPFHPRCPDAVERCRREKPELRTADPDRAVSCWVSP